MANRNTPYGAFNFVVEFDGGEVFGGFSDVSGIGTEITIAEYRNGNEKENHVRKIAGVHKVSDVTLKRGIVNSKTLFQWIKESRVQGPAAQKKSVTIRLLDEAQAPGAVVGAERGRADEVHRADFCRQGRRRRGDGGDRPRRAGHDGRGLSVPPCRRFAPPMPLVFEVASPPALPAAGRADIACFIGHVARRAGRPLPPAVSAALQAGGWIDGPWKVGGQRVAALTHVPVAVDSWTDFDNLYDWTRPVAATGPALAASTLGAAVRAFFAQGGRRAVIVRVGDPWPVLGQTTQAQRTQRLRRLLPTQPGDPMDPGSWRGIEHLHGIEEAAMVCFPDLPELYARPPATPPTAVAPRPLPETFVECSSGEAPPAPDNSLRRIAAPQLDPAGWRDWTQAVGEVRDFLIRRRRDCLFIGALPLPALDLAGPAAEQSAADPLAALLTAHVLQAAGGAPHGASSAFVQLAWPWLQMHDSGDLAQGLLPPDGVLAGMLAANALARGTFRSAAGRMPLGVIDAVPAPAWGLAPDSPWQRLAERICVFAPDPEGWVLQSDVTTSPHMPWRSGGASRVVASVLRAAREFGEVHVFGVNGPALWQRVRASFEQLLLAYWQAGGLGGASPAEAFDVRCDRTTMTQNDLDAGRVLARIELLPVAAVERITVLLALGAAERSGATLAEAA